MVKPELLLWDDIGRLRRDVQVHGVSQVDKNGIARIRPEARMLTQLSQVLLSYTRALAIKDG